MITTTGHYAVRMPTDTLGACANGMVFTSDHADDYPAQVYQ